MEWVGQRNILTTSDSFWIKTIKENLFNLGVITLEQLQCSKYKFLFPSWKITSAFQGRKTSGMLHLIFMMIVNYSATNNLLSYSTKWNWNRMTMNFKAHLELLVLFNQQKSSPLGGFIYIELFYISTPSDAEYYTIDFTGPQIQLIGIILSFRNPFFLPFKKAGQMLDSGRSSWAAHWTAQFHIWLLCLMGTICWIIHRIIKKNKYFLTTKGQVPLLSELSKYQKS